MNGLTLGDLAQSLMMRQRNVELKQQISRLSQEMASGRTADVSDTLAGDYSHLFDIERNMRVLDGYKTSTNEASTYARAMQSSLEHIQSISADFSTQLIASGNSNIPQVIQSSAAQAMGQLETVMSALNGQVAGRSLFAGAAVDTAPLIDATTLMTAVRTAITGAVSVGDIQLAVETWFDDPLGFSTVAYQGATAGISPFQLSESAQVSIDLKADNPALKAVLRHTVLAALSSDPTLGLSSLEQADMIGASGLGLLEANYDLTGLRANVGSAEAKIDQVATRNAAERTSTEYTKGALLGIDPYESATRLEQAQFHLESLYSVTVRLSRLSLLNYMQ